MERKRNHGKPDGAAAGCTERPNKNEKFDGVLEQAGTMKRHFFALVLIVSCVFGFAQARRSEAGRAQTADAADSHVPITIKIGSATVSGVLYGTALAAEIKSRFPLAVSMSDFAGREYYGGVDFYPSPEHLVGGRKMLKNSHTNGVAVFNLQFATQTALSTYARDIICLRA